MLNCYCYIAKFETICVLKRAQARLTMLLSTKCVYKSYIYLIYMYKEDLALNNLQWLICHKTKPNHGFIASSPAMGNREGKLRSLAFVW